jgi:hypothetical protein
MMISKSHERCFTASIRSGERGNRDVSQLGLDENFTILKPSSTSSMGRRAGESLFGQSVVKRTTSIPAAAKTLQIF